MGAKAVVFVAKHVGGLCWWQTDTTDYGVRQIPWRGGKGDVMADLSKSCKKLGLKLGVYLSPMDRHFDVEVGKGLAAKFRCLLCTYPRQVLSTMPYFSQYSGPFSHFDNPATVVWGQEVIPEEGGGGN